VTSALSWIHENGSRSAGAPAIVHSRLKPSNILFTRDWKVKVCDYGLGLPHPYLPAATRDDILFREQYAHYFAPEIFNGSPSTPETDAWALGMIFYTLITDSIPFQSAKDFNSLKTAVLSKQLPSLPHNTPKEFRKIIQNCWNHDPAERSKWLPRIIAESDPWVIIFKEASLQGSQEARNIWDEAVKSVGGDVKTASIPWDKFAPVFWTAFGSPKLEPTKEQCIKHLLRVSPQGEMAFDKFSQFAQTFSPFRTGPSEGPAYINDLISLCKEKWFFGLKTRVDAEGLLNSPASLKLKKEKKNPFVLRLSDTSGYKFCISCFGIEKGKEGVQNFILAPDQYENVGFLAYLRTEIKKRKLEAFPSSERQFDTLLDSSHKQLKFKATSNAQGSDSSFLGWSASLSSTGTGKFIT
jgi:serine/threonine protein kinase